MKSANNEVVFVYRRERGERGDDKEREVGPDH